MFSREIVPSIILSILLHWFSWGETVPSIKLSIFLYCFVSVGNCTKYQVVNIPLLFCFCGKLYQVSGCQYSPIVLFLWETVPSIRLSIFPYCFVSVGNYTKYQVVNIPLLFCFCGKLYQVSGCQYSPIVLFLWETVPSIRLSIFPYCFVSVGNYTKYQVVNIPLLFCFCGKLYQVSGCQYSPIVLFLWETIPSIRLSIFPYCFVSVGNYTKYQVVNIPLLFCFCGKLYQVSGCQYSPIVLFLWETIPSIRLSIFPYCFVSVGNCTKYQVVNIPLLFCFCGKLYQVSGCQYSSIVLFLWETVPSIRLSIFPYCFVSVGNCTKYQETVPSIRLSIFLHWLSWEIVPSIKFHCFSWETVPNIKLSIFLHCFPGKL